MASSSSLLSPSRLPVSLARTQRRARRSQRGLTFIELMTAAMIMALALSGLIATWLSMFSRTVVTNERTGAYQVARLVLERTRSNGYSTSIGNITPSYSRPSTGVTSSWISANYRPIRFYDYQMQEMDPVYGDKDVQAPVGARYEALTTLSWPGSYPVGREDLRLMQITVEVWPLDADRKILAEAKATLQTLLTPGGI